MVVRPARPDDAAALAAVHVETWRAAYRGIMPDAVLDGLSLARFEEHWTAQLSRPTRTNRVCEDSGRVVGFAAFGPCRDADVGTARVGELYAIYVRPDWWDRGAGWMLWSDAAAALAEEGFGEVVLWVLEANDRARRFYARAGFTAEPGMRRTIEREGARLPEVRLRTRLSAG